MRDPEEIRREDEECDRNEKMLNEAIADYKKKFGRGIPGFHISLFSPSCDNLIAEIRERIEKNDPYPEKYYGVMF